MHTSLVSLMTLIKSLGVIALATLAACPPVPPPRPGVLGDLKECLQGDTPEGANGKGAACAAGALTALKATLHAFVAEDPTLDLSTSAADNANAILDQLEAETGACADATVTQGGETSATLTVDFGDGCDVLSSGVLVSGSASVAVTKDGGTITVAFEVASLSAEGYTFDGDVTISTTDLLAYTLDIDVDVDPIGAVTFAGTTALTGSSAADLSISFDGEGTYESATARPVISGANVECSPDGPLRLSLADLHRTFAQCHADSGTLAASTDYICSGSGPRAGPDRSGTLTLSLLFDGETSSTGVATLTATVDVGFGDAPKETSAEVLIPTLRTDCGD